MAERVQVPFQVPRSVAFDYLLDPHNRTQWQSGLRAVEDVRPMPPQVGTRWRDRAVGGMVSEMRLDAVERPTMWAESGRSRGVSMNLTLKFDEVPDGCLVVAEMRFAGAGLWRAVAAVVSRVFPYGVSRDLARAARLLNDA